MTATAARPPRRRKVNWTRRARHLTQLGVAAFIFFAAARHQLGESAGVPTSSLDDAVPLRRGRNPGDLDHYGPTRSQKSILPI